MSQHHYITNVLFIKNQMDRLNRNNILKYNIYTKIELSILINHQLLDSNHNFSEYLYNSLINILLKCSKDICFDSNKSKYARSEWNRYC